jgi:hypothetical protein
MDLEDERKVPCEEGEAMAKELGAFYCEVSAKTGRGIEELFVRVAEECYKKLRGPAKVVAPKVDIKPVPPEKKQKKRKGFC